MVSNGGPAKIDIVSNRLFQPRKAPLVLSLRPSAELFVFKMDPVALTVMSPRKGHIMQNMEHWFPKWALNYRSGAP